jgi:hypothetical protein
MGERGRTWMAQEFSWPEIAQQMQSFYRFVLGLECKPAFVHTS